MLNQSISLPGLAGRQKVHLDPQQAWDTLENQASGLETLTTEAPAAVDRQPGRDPADAYRHTDKFRALALALAKAEERERRSLAQDLHDDLGQLLAVVALKVSVIKKINTSVKLQVAIDDCCRVMEQVNHKMRAMALQLAPPLLDQRGLVSTLQWLAEEVRRVYGIEVDVMDDGSVEVMDSVVLEALFRAVRELLLNVYKHAGVTRAAVSIAQGIGGTVIVSVSDEGAGFDNNSIVATNGRAAYGLLGIRERLGFLGGTMLIRSDVGDGTTVYMKAPLFLGDSIDSRKRSAA